MFKSFFVYFCSYYHLLKYFIISFNILYIQKSNTSKDKKCLLIWYVQIELIIELLELLVLEMMTNYFVFFS